LRGKGFLAALGMTGLNHRRTIAAIATSEPRMDVDAVAMAVQSRWSLGSFSGTNTVLPGFGRGCEVQIKKCFVRASTLPSGCVTYARPASPFTVSPPADRT